MANEQKTRQLLDLLRERDDELARKGERLARRIEELTQERKELSVFITRVSAEIPDTEPVEAPISNLTEPLVADSVPVESLFARRGERGNIVDPSGLDIDLTLAANLFERLVLVADAAGDSAVNMSDVTDYLVRNGISDAKPLNLRKSVDRVLRDHPEVFDKVGPGNYRLVRPATKTDEPFGRSHGTVDGNQPHDEQKSLTVDGSGDEMQLVQ